MTNRQWDELYQQYVRELYAYAYSLCQNHHLAQDLTSETFIKAMLSLEDTSYFKFWLFRVCKNLYLDQLRQNKIIPQELNEARLIDENTPLDAILDSEEKRHLYRQMMTLPEAYREVLTLFYFSDFSLDEIAGSLRISYGAAKTLLFRARRRLKTALEESHEL